MTLKTETIGQLIERIFPNGFFHHGYYYLLFNEANSSSAENEKQKFLSHIIQKTPVYYKDAKIDKKNAKLFAGYLKTAEQDYGEQYEKYYNYLNEKIPSSSDKEKYIVPPFSPFDLFALTSSLLSMSGAYHHFENAFEDMIFDRPKSRDGLGRTTFVTCNDIENWRWIGREWYNFKCEGNEEAPFVFGHRKVASKNKLEDENTVKYEETLTTYWITLLKCWDSSVYQAVDFDQEPPKWWLAAYSLMVVADEASKNVGFKKNGDEIEYDNQIDRDCRVVQRWPILAKMIIDAVDREERNNRSNEKQINKKRFKYVESISIADRGFVNILPKSRTAPLGCTLRRVSHNLAKLPGSGIIKVGWAWAEAPKDKVKKNPIFNMLLIPYPYEIRTKNFKPTGITKNQEEQCNPSELRWGAFTLDVAENYIEDREFLAFVSRLITESDERVGITHAVVLPELALSRKSIIALKELIQERHPSIELFCSGSREELFRRKGDDGTKNRPVQVNASYMASLNTNGNECTPALEFFHEKHHKWRITEQQIFDYDLSPTLDPSRIWWEDLRVIDRRLPFLVMRNQWTVTSLICEDLARNDPARTVVESIGPNLVISLLMDGPQLPDRWSARYATVLAEDPGSSVLSMSSFGLIKRSNKNHKGKDGNGSRSFALWRDDLGKSQEIKMDDGNHATTISITVYPVTDYTMDGRADCRAVSLRLTGQRQIKDPDKYNDGSYPPWGSSKE